MDLRPNATMEVTFSEVLRYLLLSLTTKWDARLLLSCEHARTPLCDFDTFSVDLRFDL